MLAMYCLFCKRACTNSPGLIPSRSNCRASFLRLKRAQTSAAVEALTLASSVVAPISSEPRNKLRINCYHRISVNSHGQTFDDDHSVDVQSDTTRPPSRRQGDALRRHFDLRARRGTSALQGDALRRHFDHLSEGRLTALDCDVLRFAHD